MKQFAFLVAFVFSPDLGPVTCGDEVISPAAERFAERNTKDVPGFQKHVVPLLGRLGCNSAKCHGSFQGQGGLRLSLFGFDFRSDHAELSADANSEAGGRLSVIAPEESLIVLKPTAQVDHEGGKRFERGSWEHHLLLRWIESGASGVVDSKEQLDATSVTNSSVVSSEDLLFFNDKVRPILEDHCYECHGFNASKGNLSLVNRDAVLAGGDSGPGAIAGNPSESLLVAAVEYATGELQMPPSGKLPSEDVQILKEWIEKGIPFPDGLANAPGETDQVLVSLHYEPQEILFNKSGQEQQLKVIAHWNDGTQEDVTCLARFQTNNDAIVTVNSDGLATSTGEGDTHIVAFYDNGVVAIPVLRPISSLAQRSLGSTSEKPVDQYVNAKLAKLGIEPSVTCSDAEFLRRVSIDLTGTLPTPSEVQVFLEDKSVKKRRKKIEELLTRPAYAAWWTNKLCDFTGCNPKSISSLLEVASEDGYVKASEWYDWIFERVEQNEPYDQIVAGLMLADLSNYGSRTGSRNDGDAGMPYFWTRQSLVEPKDTAMSVAHAFLGIQLQCAECHKHPFDQWTQADFRDFAQFFKGLQGGRRQRASASSDEIRQLQLLRSRTVLLKSGDDARQPIMDWMRDPANPWFARAFVNRVWAGYFHRGIVDPPDQFTPANPPSHPQLLDWLANGFVENGYDMKWLHRQIANSDAYQRSWKPSESNRSDQRNFSRSIPRRIPAEVVYDAMKQATAATDEQEAVRMDLRRRASGYLSMRMAGTHAMKVFGKPDRSINCDCERVNEPTLLQAIFAQNDPLVRMRVMDSRWIIEIEDAVADGITLNAEVLVDQVWLRTVARPPNDEERRRALKHLDASQSCPEGVSDLLWAMMNTKEFLLNH